MQATRRRTADETRELLLGVGVELMLQRGASAGVQHIRLQEVLRHAGLTTGAAYRIWADQTEFQCELAVRLVRLRLNDPDAVATAAIEEAVRAGAVFDEVVRLAALSHVASIERLSHPESSDARLFLIDLALRASSASAPDLLAASQERHAESVARFVGFYSALADRYGMRMRAPYSMEQFAEAMAALGEGFALRASEGLAHPHLVLEVPGAGSDWTLFAIAVRGLVREFLEPDPGSAAHSGAGGTAPPAPDDADQA